jgi:hypothetical protein
MNLYFVMVRYRRYFDACNLFEFRIHCIHVPHLLIFWFRFLIFVREFVLLLGGCPVCRHGSSGLFCFYSLFLGSPCCAENRFIFFVLVMINALIGFVVYRGIHFSLLLNLHYEAISLSWVRYFSLW